MKQPRLAIPSWCLFDWALSAFNTVIGTFVFSVYFARGIYGDETAGSAAWAQAMGLSGLAIAVLSPILGSIADKTGRRKPWLAFLLGLSVVLTATLFFARPDKSFALMALLLAGAATVAFELATVFYNALLPDVAPPEKTGRVSGWGWGLGYVGGLACLGLALVGFVKPEIPWLGLSKEGAMNIRAVALLVAGWMAVFGLPLFVFVKDRPETGVSMRVAVRDGLLMLWQTILHVRRFKNIALFLVASALYRDALATLFAVGGLYAAGTFHMGFDQIILFAIGLNVTAALGSAGFSFVDDKIGSKPTIVLSLMGLMAFGVPLLLVRDAGWFTGLALGLGIFVGPAQAASRSLLARLAPEDKRAEMFGLYALTGKSVAFLGPLAFAAATSIAHSQRAGMATILVFLLAGLVLLLPVKGRSAEVGD